MTIQGELRESSINITGIEGATSNQGQPQWKLHCRWPWTPTGNTGGDQVWVDRAAFPDWDVDTSGQFPVQVRARGCKKQSAAKQAETGEAYYDGNRDWMWQWDVISILDHAPTPAAQPQSNGSEQVVDGEVKITLDKRIAWNSAVNNAVHLHGPINPEHQLDGEFQFNYDMIRMIAADLYDLITAGPPSPGSRYALDGSELPVEAAPGAGPTQRLAQAKMVADSVTQWNLDNPQMKLTRDYIQNAMFRLYGIGEPTCQEALQMLTPEQGLELSTLIAKGFLPAKLAAVKSPEEGDDVDNLPF